MCEYYDQEKGRTRSRNYIVYLQHKVLALTDELENAARKNLSASQETENQDFDGVKLVPSTATGKASLLVAKVNNPQLTKE